MRPIFTLFMLLCCTSTVYSQQKTKQSEWQQQTDYEIDVTLNPASKTLNAFISIHYFNNSPDTLKSIWLHVWPNAYKNNETAFALQQLKNGKTDFQFCTENEKGYINGFHFMSGKDSLQWHFDKTDIDILEVKLNQPLLPHSDLKITTPFKVKLPKIFSRGGCTGSFFAITQWYPKPAVYDVNGWNTMPYLDQGEFYSEFGNFKVNITLPEKFLVAATGNLQTPSEIKRLDSVVRNGGRYVSHSNRMRTMTFEEKNIHDFAWFADTVFIVEKSFVKIPDGDTVNTWFFTNKPDKKYVPFTGLPLKPSNKAIEGYSKKVGNYPYKNCTVVIGNLIAGGGMEYPTITVCSSADKGTIIHEVGHNWFYGMLGSNERTYPWMDESINTFYEQKIDGKLDYDSSFFGPIKNSEWVNKYGNLAGYLYTAKLGISQPLNLPSDDFLNINYGAVVYAKGPLLFAYLEQQLGDSLFQKCMRQYFSKWQYRHPLPGDMQESFEKSSGRNLDWFFTDLMNENNGIDIVKKKDGFHVNGSSKLDSLFQNNKSVNPNPRGFLPETNYMNNGQKKKLITLHMPLHLPQYNTRIAVNLTPAVGYNYYDQFYVGAAFYNRTMFRKKLEYILMPAYSFASEKMVGYGKINFLFLSKNRKLFKTETGVQGQSFGMQYKAEFKLDYLRNQYTRLNPYVRFHFKHNGKVDERFDHNLQLNLYQTGLVKTQFAIKDTSYNFPSTYFFNYCKLTWKFEDKHPVHHYALMLSAEYGSNYKYQPGHDQYIKTWLNASYSYQYAKKKYFKTSFFGGYILMKQGNLSYKKFYLSGNDGNTDYQYNEAMFGRNENVFSNNVLGHQITSNNGNMRNLISFISSPENWLLSSSNEASLPGIIPFRLYLDLGFYPYKEILKPSPKPQLLYTAGITIPLFKETLEIFVPLYQSQQFKAFNQYHYSFSNSIGFKLNLNKLEPFKLIDNFRP